MVATMPRKGAVPPVAAAEAPFASTRDRDIEQSFREFRQSAVRLVERVTDLAGDEPDPVLAVQSDLKNLRSIFGKWSIDVLLALHARPSVGFEELRRSLPGISPRVLSLKLKELEQHGMVTREILDTRPPRVLYSLTERGWTVAWLARPIFLFLRLSERNLRLDRLEGSSTATFIAP